jgi:hypothetical protein
VARVVGKVGEVGLGRHLGGGRRTWRRWCFGGGDGRARGRGTDRFFRRGLRWLRLLGSRDYGVPVEVEVVGRVPEDASRDTRLGRWREREPLGDHEPLGLGSGGRDVGAGLPTERAELLRDEPPSGPLGVLERGAKDEGALACRGLDEGRPEGPRVARATCRLERERTFEHARHVLREVEPHRLRGGACRRIEDLQHGLRYVGLVDHGAVGEHLEHEERERVHVGLGAWVTEGAHELLGRRVRRLEDTRARGQGLARLVDRAPDAEIEDLRAGDPLGHGQEHVARPERVMDDGATVGVREALGDVLEQPDRVGERAPWEGLPGGELRATAREHARERLALEPLPDHVRHGGPGARRERAAAGERLGDREASAAELVVEPAPLEEALHDGAREVGVERLGEREALDGDGRAHLDVVAPVDDAEPALSGDGVDAEVVAEHVADQVEGIVGHGRAIVTNNAPWQKSNRVAHFRPKSGRGWARWARCRSRVA